MKNLEILVWNYQFSLYTKRRNISHSKYVSDSRHSFQFQTKINLWKNRPKSNFDCLDLNVRVGCFILRQINVNKKRSKWVMAMMKTYFSRFDTKLCIFSIKLLFNYYNLMLYLGVYERLHNGIYHQFSFERNSILVGKCILYITDMNHVLWYSPNIIRY